MLFNSTGFIFVFLPLTLAAFALAVRLRSPATAIAVVLAASYAFYGWWEPHLALLLGVSTAFNYAMGDRIVRAAQKRRRAAVRLLLWIGIGVDLGLLGYYKYAGFLVANLDALTGAQWAVPSIALPIGISFYTFTQIAFLVDAARSEVTPLRPADYFLFVSYFPHLVAGPIIHHRDTIPQFRLMARGGWDTAAAAAGLSIFAIGLFKKLAIADNVAPFADAAFARAAAETLALVDSWIGALAYTFQIYFDFSGYSDMAIGLSLLFGVRLPLNFASPYKATSIIEFWSRWHMSLSRFLRDYLYIPLGGNRKGPARRYLNLMATMLLGGLWHGAGWTFVAWGGLHGLYLVINHAMRFAAGQPRNGAPPWIVWPKRLAIFLAVTAAWVLFRADSIPAALTMLGGMSGAHGLGALAGHDAPLGWLAGCLLIVWACPNVYQLFARYDPTLPVAPEIAGPEPSLLRWRMTAWHAAVAGAALAGCILAIHRLSPFLYFRF